MCFLKPEEKQGPHCCHAVSLQLDFIRIITLAHSPGAVPTYCYNIDSMVFFPWSVFKLLFCMPGAVMHACDPSTGEMEVGGPGVKGYLQLHLDFRASLGYVSKKNPK